MHEGEGAGCNGSGEGSGGKVWAHNLLKVSQFGRSETRIGSTLDIGSMYINYDIT